MVDYLPLDISCLRLEWRTVLQNDWWLKAAQSLCAWVRGSSLAGSRGEERAASAPSMDEALTAFLRPEILPR